MSSVANMRAVIMLTAPAKGSGGIVEKLKSYPQVIQAAAVFGGTDVFALVEAENIHELDHLIMTEIQNIPEVLSTRTHILIPTMYYIRNE